VPLAARRCGGVGLPPAPGRSKDHHCFAPGNPRMQSTVERKLCGRRHDGPERMRQSLGRHMWGR
jgi:hypothetical protein